MTVAGITAAAIVMGVVLGIAGSMILLAYACSYIGNKTVAESVYIGGMSLVLFLALAYAFSQVPL